MRALLTPPNDSASKLSLNLLEQYLSFEMKDYGKEKNGGRGPGEDRVGNS